MHQSLNMSSNPVTMSEPPVKRQSVTSTATHVHTQINSDKLSSFDYTQHHSDYTQHHSAQEDLHRESLLLAGLRMNSDFDGGTDKEDRNQRKETATAATTERKESNMSDSTDAETHSLSQMIFQGHSSLNHSVNSPSKSSELGLNLDDSY